MQGLSSSNCIVHEGIKIEDVQTQAEYTDQMHGLSSSN